jgi:hypothetical protein
MSRVHPRQRLARQARPRRASQLPQKSPTDGFKTHETVVALGSAKLLAPTSCTPPLRQPQQPSATSVHYALAHLPRHVPSAHSGRATRGPGAAARARTARAVLRLRSHVLPTHGLLRPVRHARRHTVADSGVRGPDPVDRRAGVQVVHVVRDGRVVQCHGEHEEGGCFHRGGCAQGQTRRVRGQPPDVSTRPATPTRR